MFNANKLKLGLFGANCSGGLAATKVPERWNASWENNRALGQMADEAGIEFMLPLARWFGYGGTTAFQNYVLETVTWASGLLASTRRITIFATTHVSFFHPVVAAKQIATMDHIGAGRYGLNIVCGWNQAEYSMFGVTLPNETESRYAYGQEWFDIVRKIWKSDEPFDWNGEYFKLKRVQSNPKPFGGVLPPIINAGASGQGRDFGTRNADFCFVVLSDLEKGRKDVAEIQGHARARYGREVGVYNNAYVVCRPTSKEAHDYHEHYAIAEADSEAVDNLMAGLGLSSKSFPEEFYQLYRTRFAAGHGGYPLVGDPDEVANELERISLAGYAGVALSFVDYLDELPFFRDEVLPRLEARGLREALK